MYVSKKDTTLIRPLKELNKAIVVVLSAGSAIELPFADDVNAIVNGCLGGQAGALAMVKVLKGEVNPSGKLSESYPMEYKDTLSPTFFPSHTRVMEYREGLYVGYRYYEKANIPVRYPFGYGLSYTTFEYSNINVTDKGVSFTLTNTGNLKGKEIAQMYVSKKDTTLIRPLKELKGFVKVELLPGESKEVFIPFDEYTFSHYNLSTSSYEVEGGEYNILVGASSSDIKLETSINKEATTSQIDNNTNLTKYMSGLVRDVTKEEFEALLGREVPSGELNFINKKKNRIIVDLNTTVIELKYAKGWAGRFFSGVIRFVISFAKFFGAKAWANTLIMGVVHQPMRGLSRMTGGAIRWPQLLGLLDAFNGHFCRGINTFFKEGRKIKKAEKAKRK
jgi:beta-glucosidase